MSIDPICFRIVPVVSSNLASTLFYFEIQILFILVLISSPFCSLKLNLLSSSLVLYVLNYFLFDFSSRK